MKKTGRVTAWCNLFALLLFVPGALGFRFSPYYLVAVTAIDEFYGLIQFYSALFRGSPFRPDDLTVLDGAFQMRNDYSLVHPEGFALMAIALANVACISRFIFSKNIIPSRKTVRQGVAVFGGLLLSYFIFQFKGIVKEHTTQGIILNWDLPALYPGAGNFLGFYIDYRRTSYGRISPSKQKSVI